MNVKGLNSPNKRQMAWKQACMLRCDLMCFQETRITSHKSPTFQHHNFPHVYMANGSSKKRGVAIAIKNSVQFTQLEVHLDVSGRFIILVCEINKAVYTLVNVYLPNYKQLPFLEKKFGRKSPPSVRDM